MDKSVWWLVSILFFVANPIGNSPAIISFLKDFELARQKKILLRESAIALVLAIFFLFVGDYFMDVLNIKTYTLSFCGGILLLIVAIRMIYPHHEEEVVSIEKKEPFVVPIATPLITGPGLMTIIMVYAQKTQDNYLILEALLITWVLVTFVLFISPYLKVFLRDRGMLALEQLMGMIVTMISIEMIVNGTSGFIQALNGS